MSVESDVIELKHKHAETWRYKPDWFWLLSLVEEVIELSLALIGWHSGPVEWELLQISAICMNWIEKRINNQSARARPAFPEQATWMGTSGEIPNSAPNLKGRNHGPS